MVEPDEVDELLVGVLIVVDEREGVELLLVVVACIVLLLVLRDGVEDIPVLLVVVETPLFAVLLRELCTGVVIL